MPAASAPQCDMAEKAISFTQMGDGLYAFTARGANSGIQDADNLGWKLHTVLRGQASDSLLGHLGDGSTVLALGQDAPALDGWTAFDIPDAAITAARRIALEGRMSNHILTPNIPDPDGFYANLVAAHDRLSEAQSQALNARLILILTNHIGDRAILSDALHTAQIEGAKS